ncbi:hypothetical protein F9B85_11475 [Heliorestis acidaminivorans]|uniref:Vitamin K epoxide reductase family protein n=1 Tax=Heliorestis acidaminivorans TaxID=553427 RepID=A0A6I0EP43_9FIRM|nr:hypothetical protein [Heliorestis acidaminivorans]KAB2951647.1 hypothetical protein F9B85_11475 [Heliorestis acidaminivorans]
MTTTRPFLRPHRLAAYVSLTNALFLLYVAWDKYITDACSVCSFIPWLSIGDEVVGLLGAMMAMLIAFLAYQADRRPYFGHGALFLSLFSVIFGTALQIGRYYSLGSYCVQCIISDGLFALTALFMAIWFWNQHKQKQIYGKVNLNV